MMQRTGRWTSLLLGAALAAGCSPADDAANGDARDTTPDGSDGGGDADATWEDGRPDVTESCTPGEIDCEGSRMIVCNAAGTGWDAPVDCVDPTPACTPGFGCTLCTGGEGTCAGDVAGLCMPDGSGWYADDACDPAVGERCDGGYCTDLTGACEDARRNRSYEGCDYFVTQTINSTLLGPAIFRYAVVVGNRNIDAAHVQVFDGDVEVGSADVPSNGTAAIELDWKGELRSPRGSSIVGGGAFRVRSDLPVTVYQFNPLRYWEESRPLYPGSYTNDASLVLPRNVLSGRYVVAARETLKKVETDSSGVESTTPISGFAAIVATRNDTLVTVTYSAHTRGGAGVPGQGPGDTAEYTLQKGDVLQLLSEIPTDCAGTNWGTTIAGNQIHYCQIGPEYDLTGTLVAANKPVSVFGGHDCTFVPYDRWACDHLEEQIFPAESLGRRYIAAQSESIRGEGNIWRIVSAADGNEVTFTPAAAHAPMTLGHGEHREFESNDDFLVTGTGPLLLVQYFIGEGDDMDSIGDPSMGLAVPIEQYRTEYNFLSPEDYRDEGPRQVGQNWINVIVPDGSTAFLDGVEYADYTAIGSTGYGVARIEVPGGSHNLTSPDKVGVMCYGYGNYTSYLYPAGLNVDPINTVIIF